MPNNKWKKITVIPAGWIGSSTPHHTIALNSTTY